MRENDYFDPDDIRVRAGIDMHPQFYWRSIYDADNDRYNILPFMRINNSDDAKADWMDVQVSQKHEIQYRREYEAFKEKQKLKRFIFTRDEMMRIQQFRDKIEYYKDRIRLPESHPQYWPLISDFSIRLNPEDIVKLNNIDGIEEEEKPSKTKDDKILDVLSVIADKLDSLEKRVTQIEQE